MTSLTQDYVKVESKDNILSKIISMAREYSRTGIGNRKVIQLFIDQLELWFIVNRPDNEVEITQRSWKNIWYHDGDIGDRYGFKLNRNKIWQVIKKNNYYNVSENSIICLKFTNYLEGEYSITNLPNEKNKGEKRLNTIDLTFTYNGIRASELTKDVSVKQLVDTVDHPGFCGMSKNAIPIPGPIGQKGKLWNVHIDNDYRIACGYNLGNPDVIDLYILEAKDEV